MSRGSAFLLRVASSQEMLQLCMMLYTCVPAIPVMPLSWSRVSPEINPIGAALSGKSSLETCLLTKGKENTPFR